MYFICLNTGFYCKEGKGNKTTSVSFASTFPDRATVLKELEKIKELGISERLTILCTPNHCNP